MREDGLMDAEVYTKLMENVAARRVAAEKPPELDIVLSTGAAGRGTGSASPCRSMRCATPDELSCRRNSSQPRSPASSPSSSA